MIYTEAQSVRMRDPEDENSRMQSQLSVAPVKRRFASLRRSKKRPAFSVKGQ